MSPIDARRSPYERWRNWASLGARTARASLRSIQLSLSAQLVGQRPDGSLLVPQWPEELWDVAVIPEPGKEAAGGALV